MFIIVIASVWATSYELIRRIISSNRLTHGEQSMFSVKKCAVPANTLLAHYSMAGNYTNCYTTEVDGRTSFPEYVFAFYTSLLFRLERSILRVAVSKPSTDKEARRLSDGACDKFAAWHVENRREDEKN